MHAWLHIGADGGGVGGEGCDGGDGCSGGVGWKGGGEGGGGDGGGEGGGEGGADVGRATPARQASSSSTARGRALVGWAIGAGNECQLKSCHVPVRRPVYRGENRFLKNTHRPK